MHHQHLLCTGKDWLLIKDIPILILGIPDQVEEQLQEADQIEPDQDVDEGLVVQEEGILGTRAQDPGISVRSGSFFLKYLFSKIEL